MGRGEGKGREGRGEVRGKRAEKGEEWRQGEWSSEGQGQTVERMERVITVMTNISVQELTRTTLQTC